MGLKLHVDLSNVVKDGIEYEFTEFDPSEKDVLEDVHALQRILEEDCGLRVTFPDDDPHITLPDGTIEHITNLDHADRGVE